ncbi:type I polyketide synthase [Nocardia brasiliensis]|uniref:type I polyketide synthase n=1 Tax=Nocardia brasiliensis TaxID=37326 RepID=UPI0034012D9D
MSGISDAVAIIGIGCRFGGGIDSAESMWRALVDGRDLITEVPVDRWDVGPVYDPRPGVPGKTFSRWGAFIDDVTGFEPEFFGLTDREAELIDPQFRLVLETSCEALEHAGYPPHDMRGSATAVVVGCSYEDYMDMMDFDRGLRSPDAAHGIIGTTRFTSSSRVAYLLDLRGPAITLDTACSSSLVAVHLAAEALRSGETDLALAGGVMLSLQAKNTLVFAALGVLSPTGRCHAFDASGDGYVRGEGCGMIVLKRLNDAVADGDRVLAVLAGTGVNNNGRSDTMLSPSVAGQRSLQERVLAKAGVDPRQVALIETHGPGTAVGDPIEYAALRAVYGDGEMPCALGSVKTNIGHCETASGIAGLIKAVQAVRYGSIPANLHFTKWNPEIDPRHSRLFVPTALTPWPTSKGPRLAAVSSYGMSGTNAHVLVEQAPEPVAAVSDSGDAGLLYPLSAGSVTALAATATRIAHWLNTSGAPLRDVGHTLAHCREHRRVRAVIAAADPAELLDRLHRLADGLPDADTWTGTAVPMRRGPVWLFSGQGSQWAGMGRHLLAAEPAFAATIAELDPLVQAESGFSVRAAMTADEVVTGFATVQPTLFAMQVALAATWRAHGVEPAAVIGHSMGEIAAAVVAGALSAADGAAVICRRSRLLAKLPGPGAMAQVMLPAEQVATELSTVGSDDVSIAAFTAPTSTVISGARDLVHALVAKWQAADVQASAIAVDVASHSRQVDPVLAELRGALSNLHPAKPAVSFYSTVLDDPRHQPNFDAEYWSDNVRLPVRFTAAFAAAVADGHRAFIEVSPHPLLTHAVADNAEHVGREVIALPSAVRDQTTALGLLPRVAAAYCAGVQMNWPQHRAGSLADVPLPVWARRPLWMPAEILRRAEDHRLGAPLLGVHVTLPDDGLGRQHLWQADVGVLNYPWLADHRVYDTPAMPGAGYAEIALATAADLFETGMACEIHDLTFRNLLALDEHTTVTTRATVVTPTAATLEISAPGEDGPVPLAVAVIRTRASGAVRTVHVEEMLAEQQPAQSPDPVYAIGRRKGILHGPCFAGLAAVHPPGRRSDTVVAQVRMPTELRAFPDGFGIHPVLLDLCLQTMGAHPDILRTPATFLPLHIGRVRRLGNPDRAEWCRARLRSIDDVGACADIELLDADGAVLVQVVDARIGTTAQQSETTDARLLSIEWDAAPLTVDAVDTTAAAWLLCTENADDVLASALAAALRMAGGRCDIRFAPVSELIVATDVTDYDHLVVLCPPPPAQETAAGVDRARLRARRVIGLVRAMVDAAAGTPQLSVVTRGAQSAPGTSTVTLEQASLRGLCRVLGAEHPELAPRHIDLPAESDDPAALVAELLSESNEDEVAWREGVRHVARLRPAPFRDTERRTRTARFGYDGMAPRPRHRGDLGSMELAARPRRAPDGDEIEIAVHAAGLNFTDVLNAMDRLPVGGNRPPDLGYDCAGVVTAVGADVRGMGVGDRVAAFTSGALATFVTVAAAKAFPIPDTLGMTEAATLPTVYLTAWYALHHLARIRPGEHVLIHSATGGLGAAAIALAQATGAVVYATAGTEAKRQLLRDNGITNVYDSRSLDFAPEIRTVTDGVDVVLNSLTGPALRAGVELLRPGGRFIELGRHDIYADAKLGLAPFQRNIIFASADLAFIGATMPDLIAQLVREVGEQIVCGGVRPLPHTIYPLADLESALRTMAAAEHTGKLVVTVPQQGTVTAILLPDEVPVVRPHGAYVITGGLGGLGLLLATHLADHGAGRIVLNGRSRPNEHARNTIDALRRRGTDITVELGDITDPTTADMLIAAATSTGLPVCGIAHAAAVIADATVANIDDGLLDRVWSAKAVGGWHLDQASATEPLDWWLSYSSAAAMIGNPGQGAYAAANSWLDAFSHYRRSRGDSAHSIWWGAWENHGRGAGLAERGFTMITPAQGLAACERILRHDRPNTGYLPLHDAQQFIGDRLRTTPFFTALATRDSKDDGSDTAQHELLAAARDAQPPERRALLTEFLVDISAKILRRNTATLDPDSPLADSGLDSLMALELRNHIERALGLRLAAKSIWKFATPAALARHLADHFEQ